MKQTIHEERLHLRLMRSQSRVAALEQEKKILQNQLLAPQAANARFQAARQDALTVHIDMETLERIEKMRLNVIAREIRDRVMQSKPKPRQSPRKKVRNNRKKR